MQTHVPFLLGLGNMGHLTLLLDAAFTSKLACLQVYPCMHEVPVAESTYAI